MQPKKRLPRIEREDPVRVAEDDNQHLWAVSYSDFLMALLSFFILFFSMETPERKSVILQLANTFQTGGSTSMGASGTGSSELSSLQPSRITEGLFQQLTELDVKIEKDSENLVINFPNDFFNPGQHTVRKEQTPLITTFLQTLKPYDGKINIYFEGHTDSTPLRKSKNDIIVDNYVLSSLRASTILRMAQQQGFKSGGLYIEAAANNLRNTRSLSVRIEAKKETL